jgi:hypothetical protein
MSSTRLTETQKATLRKLTDEFALTKDHFFVSPQGFITVTRPGIDKIAAKLKADVFYNVIPEFSDVSSKHYVVLCVASVVDSDNKLRQVSMFGESSPDNCKGGAKSFPVAMAQKRAYARAILMLAQLYQESVFAEDEMIVESAKESVADAIGYKKTTR